MLPVLKTGDKDHFQNGYRESGLTEVSSTITIWITRSMQLREKFLLVRKYTFYGYNSSLLIFQILELTKSHIPDSHVFAHGGVHLYIL